MLCCKVGDVDGLFSHYSWATVHNLLDLIYLNFLCLRERDDVVRTVRRWQLLFWKKHLETEAGTRGYSPIQHLFVSCSFVRLLRSFMYKHTMSHTQTDVFIRVCVCCVRNEGCCWVCCFPRCATCLLAVATEAWRICLHSVPRTQVTETRTKETLNSSCLAEWRRWINHITAVSLCVLCSVSVVTFYGPKRWVFLMRVLIKD